MVLDIKKGYGSIRSLFVFSNFLFFYFFTGEKIPHHFSCSGFFEKLSEGMSCPSGGDEVIYEEDFFAFQCFTYFRIDGILVTNL